MEHRSISEIVRIINEYYEDDFATESFNKGRDTIYIDIPSVLSKSFSEEEISFLSVSDDVISGIKEIFPVLQHFNSKDIVVKKDDFKSEVIYSSRLEDKNFDEEVISNNVNEKSDFIKINNGIEYLNKFFKKRYVNYSKKGVIFNIGSLYKKPFPKDIENRIKELNNIEDAKIIIKDICSLNTYKNIDRYLLDENCLTPNNCINTSIETAMQTNQKDIIVGNMKNESLENEETRKILDKVNKWLESELNFDLNGNIFYEMKAKLSKSQKKKKKKVKVEKRLLPNALVQKFLDIKIEEDVISFLLELYQTNSSIFLRKPAKIFRDKIYIEKVGFVDDCGLLNSLRNLNERFNSPQIVVADELKIKNKGAIKDSIILKMIDIQKNENIEQYKKSDFIFDILEKSNIINPKEYKFYGCQEMIELETVIIKKAETAISSYKDMLEKLTLKTIKMASTFLKNITLNVDYECVELLKRKLKDGLFEPKIERYKDIIEVSSPLYNITFFEKDLNSNHIYDDVITINNEKCKFIENIYTLHKKNVFNILSYYKDFTKKTIEHNAQNIIESLNKEGRYNNKDIAQLNKELCVDIYFSNIKLSLDKIWYIANDYNIDFFENELLRKDFDNNLENDIKKYQEILLNKNREDWDRILNAKKEATDILNNKEYAIISCLVGNEKNKGITTYVNILLGKKSEYSSSNLYGKLSYLKADTITDMIETLIDLNVLNRENRKASFGRYTAIVKGIYYDNDIESKIEQDNFTNNKNVSASSKEISLVDNKHKNALTKNKLTGSFIEFLNSVKDINLELVNKEDINITELDLKDIDTVGSILCKEKRYFNKNWDLISKLIPILSEQAIMFLTLKSINNGDCLKKIIEIEEAKRGENND